MYALLYDTLFLCNPCVRCFSCMCVRVCVCVCVVVITEDPLQSGSPGGSSVPNPSLMKHAKAMLLKAYHAGDKDGNGHLSVDEYVCVFVFVSRVCLCVRVLRCMISCPERVGLFSA